MPLGTVVFSEEVIGPIVRCELHDGRIILVAEVPGPHPPFDANNWRVHGEDGSLIYTVKARKPIMVSARHEGYTTTAFCPISLLESDDIEAPVSPPKRLPTDGTVTYDGT